MKQKKSGFSGVISTKGNQGFIDLIDSDGNITTKKIYLSEIQILMPSHTRLVI